MCPVKIMVSDYIFFQPSPPRPRLNNFPACKLCIPVSWYSVRDFFFHLSFYLRRIVYFVSAGLAQQDLTVSTLVRWWKVYPTTRSTIGLCFFFLLNFASATLNAQSLIRGCWLQFIGFWLISRLHSMCWQRRCLGGGP